MRYNEIKQPENTEIQEGWKDKIAGAAMGVVAGVAATSSLNNYHFDPHKVPAHHAEVQDFPRSPKGILERAAVNAGLAGEELAQFMAQCAHETMNFTRMVEMGTKKYFLRKYDRKYNPQKAKILGNNHVGDGVRYRGRGYIQLTGRENYSRAGQALGIPLEEHPDLASRYDTAAKIAIWYWKQRVAPNVDDFSNTKQVTKGVNPNLRGLKSRKEYFDKYKSIAELPDDKN